MLSVSNELMKTEMIPTSHVQHMSNPILNSIIGTKCIFNINFAVLGNNKNNLEVELSMNYTNPYPNLNTFRRKQWGLGINYKAESYYSGILP